MFAVDDRYRLAPVSLAVESPVLHLVLNALFADSLLLQELEHLRDGFLLGGDSVEELRVDHFAVACVSLLRNVAALYDLDYVDSELLREVVVALVVRRDSHYSTRAVTHHYVVGDVDRDLPAVRRVDSLYALDSDSGLVLDKLGALKLGLLGALVLVGLERVDVLYLIVIGLDDRMLGRDDHEGDAEHRVGTGRVDSEIFADIRTRVVNELKLGESALGATDPVLLLELYIRKIINLVESGEELVGVLGYAQIPDILRLLDYVAVADIALAALRILVREDDLAGGAVVDESLRAEDKPGVEHLAEDPLSPLVVALLGGVDDSRPVEREADTL